MRGYTRIFENMLFGDANVTVRLNVDFFSARQAALLPAHGTRRFSLWTSSAL